MKERILAALVCAVMAASLAGCAAKNEGSVDDILSAIGGGSGSSSSNSAESSSKPEQSSKLAESSSKPEENSSKPAESSSKPAQSSSKPEETSRPAASTIDWDSVPYADELDFLTGDVSVNGVKAAAVSIEAYLGSEKVLKIPETIGGKKVVLLKSLNNYDVTDLHVPSNVSRIDTDFFKGFRYNDNDDKLKSVVLSDKLTSTDFINGGRFANRHKIIFTLNGKTYTTPDDIIALTDAIYPGEGKVRIKDGVLWKVSITLKNYDIPDDVSYIGDGAFEHCDLITDITIPGNIKDVGTYPGKVWDWNVPMPITNCENLKTITIAEGVTKISSLVSWCPNLSVINLPSTLTSIGANAFGYLPALKKITVPDSVTYIGEDAFDGASAIEEVTYKGRTYKKHQLPNLYKLFKE